MLTVRINDNGEMVTLTWDNGRLGGDFVSIITCEWVAEKFDKLPDRGIGMVTPDLTTVEGACAAMQRTAVILGDTKARVTGDLPDYGDYDENFTGIV